MTVQPLIPVDYLPESTYSTDPASVGLKMITVPPDLDWEIVREMMEDSFNKLASIPISSISGMSVELIPSPQDELWEMFNKCSEGIQRKILALMRLDLDG